MSSLPHLLEQLRSADNSVRRQAEKILSSEGKRHPDQLIRGLIELVYRQIYEQQGDQQTAIHGLVILRRICFMSSSNLLWNALSNTMGGGKPSNLSTRTKEQEEEEQGTIETNNNNNVCWNYLHEETKIMVKQVLLSCLRDMNCKKISTSFQLKIVQAISELALQSMSSPSDWPELIQFIFETLQSPLSTEHQNQAILSRKCAALDILTGLLDVFGDSLPTYSGTVKNLLSPILMMKVSADSTIAQDVLTMRLAALNCLRAYLGRVSSPGERHQFIDLVPSIWDIVELGLNLQDEERCSQALDQLIMLAEESPSFFKTHIGIFVSGLTVHVMSRRELETTTLRQSALEFLTTLAEKAPAMIRRHCKESHPQDSYIYQIIPVILSMMTEIETSDDDDHDQTNLIGDIHREKGGFWSTADVLDDDEAMESVSVAAEIALDRLACALGGKLVLPVVFQWLPDMLKSSQWQKRSAAWLALSVIAEGCRKPLEKELNHLVDIMVQQGLRDSHPRVRYACINCIGQMCTDLAPKLQHVYHDKILPGLISAMTDGHPRVQSHAASALVNFCESLTDHGLERSRLSSYLDAILQCLFGLLQSKKRFVQEQALQSIASMADAAKTHFERFYDTFMPILKSILQESNTKEWNEFQARALDCATLIGLAVGKTRFFSDARDLMNLIHQQSQLTSSPISIFAEGPLQSYFLGSMGRLSQALQLDFVPYLPWLMPSLMERIQLKPEMVLLPAGQEQDDSHEDGESTTEETNPGWEFIDLGGNQKIGIRTSAIEEKRNALDLVVTFSRDLVEGFSDYAESVLGICLSLFDFYLDEDIRVTSVGACAPLLMGLLRASRLDRCSAAAITIFNQLILSLQKESEPSMVATYLEAWRACSIDVLGTEPKLFSSVITESLLHTINACLVFHLEQFRKRSLEREQTRSKHEDALDESLMEEEECDEAMLHAISDLIRSSLKTMPTIYLSIFESSLLPMYSSMLVARHQPEQYGSIVPPSWAQWALCVFDDLIEQLGSSSFKYQHHFLPYMLQALNDPHPGIRQAAAYGVGICASRGDQVFMPFCIEAVPYLVNAIQDPNARNDTYETATENCISALGKIYRYGHSQLGDQGDVLLDFWLNHLPIIDDVEEAEATYPFFCELVETQNPVALRDPTRIARISGITLASEVLATCDPIIRERLARLFQLIVHVLTKEQQDLLWNGVSEDVREHLRTLF